MGGWTDARSEARYRGPSHLAAQRNLIPSETLAKVPQILAELVRYI